MKIVTPEPRQFTHKNYYVLLKTETKGSLAGKKMSNLAKRFDIHSDIRQELVPKIQDLFNKNFKPAQLMQTSKLLMNTAYTSKEQRTVVMRVKAKLGSYVSNQTKEKNQVNINQLFDHISLILFFQIYTADYDAPIAKMENTPETPKNSIQ